MMPILACLTSFLLAVGIGQLVGHAPEEVAPDAGLLPRATYYPASGRKNDLASTKPAQRYPATKNRLLTPPYALASLK